MIMVAVHSRVQQSSQTGSCVCVCARARNQSFSLSSFLPSFKNYDLLQISVPEFSSVQFQSSGPACLQATLSAHQRETLSLWPDMLLVSIIIPFPNFALCLRKLPSLPPTRFLSSKWYESISCVIRSELVLHFFILEVRGSIVIRYTWKPFYIIFIETRQRHRSVRFFMANRSRKQFPSFKISFLSSSPSKYWSKTTLGLVFAKYPYPSRFFLYSARYPMYNSWSWLSLHVTRIVFFVIIIRRFVHPIQHILQWKSFVLLQIKEFFPSCFQYIGLQFHQLGGLVYLNSRFVCVLLLLIMHCVCIKG
jgi:hypothetical protein